MTWQLYGLFLIASAVLIATPGPNVALIVGTSIRHGRRAGLATVTGVNAGLTVQLVLVAMGLASVAEFYAKWFDVIRYVGVAYLIVLAVLQLMRSNASDTANLSAPELPRRRAAARGFAVAMANPKTLLFHAAFLPQFLPADGAVYWIWILAASFAVIGYTGDAMFALVAARTGTALSGRFTKLADRVSAGVLLGGAATLLVIRRT